MDETKKYISGLGKESVVPPEIKGWNWGAFLLNWIWGIGNSTYVALLMFVPLVNLVMLFMLGARGNEWAWQNRTWRDVEHFKETQRKWAITGVVLIVLGLPLFIFAIVSALKGEAYQLSLAAIKSNAEVSELIGAPIEPGILVMGSINLNGLDGSASLQYSVSGPKGVAKAFVLASKDMGQWALQQVVVNSEEQSKKIQVIPSRVSGETRTSVHSKRQPHTCLSLITQEKYKEAFGRCRIEAVDGDMEAAHNLGTMYEEGVIIKRDYDNALKWYTKAANAGVPEAQYGLGGMYYRGRGITKDLKSAFKWYKKAADSGHAKSNLYVGVMYGDGTGIKRDLNQARIYFNNVRNEFPEKVGKYLNHLNKLDSVK